jgi:membrane-associated phospholipid phosphatase
MTSAERFVLARRWLPHFVASIVLAVLLVWDNQINAAIENFRFPFLTWLSYWVSQLRGATFPAAIGLLLMAIGWAAKKARLRRAGAAMILTIVLAGLITTVMKEVIGRPGPDVDHIVRPGESWLDVRFGRFPSSHSAIMFGSASVLTAFVPATAVPGYTLAVLVCHERIYRGTHYPSDIFAGIWIGLVIARFMVAQLRRRGWLDDLVPARPGGSAPEIAGYAWVGKKPKVGDEEDVA